MDVIRECPMCGVTKGIRIKYETYEEISERKRPIQEIVPDFNPTEREFLISGYCPDCQEMLFGVKHKSKRIFG